MLKGFRINKRHINVSKPEEDIKRHRLNGPGSSKQAVHAVVSSSKRNDLPQVQANIESSLKEPEMNTRTKFLVIYIDFMLRLHYRDGF